MNIVSPNLRVLVVDGYADASESMAFLLTHWGHSVRIAYSAPEALAIGRSFRPDVALLELKLDGMDGYRLADRLRADCNPRMRIVALTGLGDAVSRQRARDAGFDSFLLKPVDPERVRRLLCRFAPVRPKTFSREPLHARLGNDGSFLRLPGCVAGR
jgi:CheY-like chemotaxis protein